MKNLCFKVLLVVCFCFLSIGWAQAEKITVRGRVMHSTNIPINKGRVEIAYHKYPTREARQNQDHRVIASTRTDYNGNYELKTLIDPQMLTAFRGYRLVVSYCPQMFSSNHEIVNYSRLRSTYNLKDIVCLGAFVPIQFLAGHVTDNTGTGNPIADSVIQIKNAGTILGETTTRNDGLYRTCVYLPIEWSSLNDHILIISANKNFYNENVPVASLRGEQHILAGNDIDQNNNLLEKHAELVCRKTSLVPNPAGLKFLSSTNYTYNFYGEGSGYFALDLADQNYLVLNNNQNGYSWASIGFDLLNNSTIDVTSYSKISVVALIKTGAPETNFWINLRDDPDWPNTYIQARTETATIPAGNGNARFVQIDFPLNLNSLFNDYGSRNPMIDLSRLCHLGIEFGETAGNYDDSCGIIVYDITFCR